MSIIKIFEWDKRAMFMFVSAPGSREMIETLDSLDKLFDNRVVAPCEAALDATATLIGATIVEEQVVFLIQLSKSISIIQNSRFSHGLFTFNRLRKYLHRTAALSRQS